MKYRKNNNITSLAPHTRPCIVLLCFFIIIALAIILHANYYELLKYLVVMLWDVYIIYSFFVECYQQYKVHWIIIYFFCIFSHTFTHRQAYKFWLLLFGPNIIWWPRRLHITLYILCFHLSVNVHKLSI